MKKFFTFFAAALMSVSMFGKIVTEDIPLNPETWGWGYNSSLNFNDGIMTCTLTGEWGAMATGWNEPTKDLSEWDKIVIVVENMNGCDGEWFKLKAYLRDYVNKDSEQGQMEAVLGLEEADNQQHYMVINLKEEGKNVNLTACGVLAIQCQPNSAIFKISRVYLEKQDGEMEYFLVGSMNGWQANDEFKFEKNEATPGEYMLPGVDLAKDDSLKVIGTDGELTTWYPDNAPNYVVAENGTYDIYFRADGQGGDDWYYHYIYVAAMKSEVTLILANFPDANKPEQIELAGTFNEGAVDMEKLDTGWFIYNFINATANATGKFRSKANNDLVLCQYIPANGAAEGKWVQAIFKFSDYWYWDADGWKGTPCMWFELDLKNDNYAWMEGMPEPEPGDLDPTEGVANTVATVKAVKIIRNGQLFVIKNGKTFNALGVEVK